jgi:steroid delta-isomerase-like uncharacterized protein
MEPDGLKQSSGGRRQTDREGGFRVLITSAQPTRRSFLNQSGLALGAMFVGPEPFPCAMDQIPLGREKIVQELYAAYAALNVEGLLSLLTESCFFEDPTFHLVARGKPEIRKMAESLPRLYSGLKVTVENLIACDDWVITQQQVSGLYKAKPDGGGVKTVSVRGATIFGFEGDKISRWVDYYDYATYIKQTGL